jgi:hypothetical protein
MGMGKAGDGNPRESFKESRLGVTMLVLETARPAPERVKGKSNFISFHFIFIDSASLGFFNKHRL